MTLSTALFCRRFQTNKVTGSSVVNGLKKVSVTGLTLIIPGRMDVGDLARGTVLGILSLRVIAAPPPCADGSDSNHQPHQFAPIDIV